MKLKSILLVVAISASTAVLSVWGYGKWMQHQYAGTQDPGKLPVNYARFFDKNAPAGPVDFTSAATSATPAVVHIKTRTKARQVTNNLPKRKNPFSDFFGGDDDPFSDFFGGPRVSTIPEQRASGSGVLISEDGYIVTNNHVVEGADELNITLANKKTYKATVIGTDPNSDLAVIKIEGSHFPYLVYGNSDDAKLGQWVLAVGYPLNLDVTVTAGIISAKSRAIGINKGDTPIESFIQTDAAVNPGNSGGALINTSGELIGINSAIASPTGSYAGYSYAIPVNIVKKMVNDLIKFGAVQRGYIGIKYGPDNLSDEQRKLAGIKDGDGVYVTDVMPDGSAKAAGILKGDFITKIEGSPIESGSQLQEQIARYKPGDKINVTYTRNGKEYTTPLVLKNKVGTTTVVKSESAIDKLGGELVTIDKATAQKNNIAGGVLVKKVGTGALKSTRMQDGFVITDVNGQEIKSLDDLKNALKNASGQVRLGGVYPGYEGTYAYPLVLDGGGSDAPGDDQ
ncbi:trypsin-like peptidase domain-containing protein [Deminuibacter soli]|uniref:PDZ domain-containing protein n=1 Tax=Deminuibacter soli TaxID=2291815 RepID=A0A3E1NLR8_9BACT|nr:trypsin-like peptidase domain-containing protein [Deminuibacter soli]RFM28876.1 PDZ domain-containing protein [Deminuibacter soli]